MSRTSNHFFKHALYRLLNVPVPLPDDYEFRHVDRFFPVFCERLALNTAYRDRFSIRDEGVKVDIEVSLRTNTSEVAYREKGSGRTVEEARRGANFAVVQLLYKDGHVKEVALENHELRKAPEMKFAILVTTLMVILSSALHLQSAVASLDTYPPAFSTQRRRFSLISNVSEAGMQSDEQLKTEKERQNREEDDIDVESVENTFEKLAIEDRREETEEEDERERRVPDDLIDKFCDKLQKAHGNEIEGMFAMQYINLEPEEVRKAITGKKQVLQVLFDSERDHYVLVEWHPPSRSVLLYDSLQSSACGRCPNVPKCVVSQIIHMFGHLCTKQERIPLEVNMSVAQQQDGWSCGYRALANVCLRAKQEEVGGYKTKVKRVGKLLDYITRIEKPTLRDFERYEIAEKLECDEEVYVRCFIKPNGKIEPASKRNRTDSNCSESSFVSGSTDSSDLSYISYTDSESSDEAESDSS